MEASRLAAIPFFATLEPEHLTALAAVASEVGAEAGQTLAGEGDFGHAFYAIESGTADVSVDGSAVRTLGPGDVFGEIAVVKSGKSMTFADFMKGAGGAMQPTAMAPAKEEMKKDDMKKDAMKK